MYFFLVFGFQFYNTILFIYIFRHIFEVEYDIIDFALSCNLLSFNGFVTHQRTGWVLDLQNVNEFFFVFACSKKCFLFSIDVKHHQHHFSCRMNANDCLFYNSSKFGSIKNIWGLWKKTTIHKLQMKWNELTQWEKNVFLLGAKQLQQHADKTWQTFPCLHKIQTK